MWKLVRPESKKERGKKEMEKKSFLKKSGKMLAAFLAVVLVMAFSVVPVQAASKRIVKSVSLSKSRLSLNEGETASVKATVKSTKKAAAKDLGVKIKSSNKSVAAAKIAKKPSGKGTKGV